MKKLFGSGGSVPGASKLGAQPLFGGHASSSNAPIPSSSQQSNDRDYRGHTMNVAGMNVTIESKLAEGGFSIVFLVKHCHPRQTSGRLFALKRQFVNESALLEACKREIEITRTLGVRHPNIVTYIASSLSPVPNSDGNVYEYLLLTEYYRGSVLRLMNERLSLGQWLSTDEVMRIFTDVCTAVARLHHCQTPVVHRDLKVENLLLDDDGRCVLCDFGSATTRVVSTKTHSRTVVEDEIARFTTLSYRAPEMVDLYAGNAITTKADIWALGVMLYKLCYFALPFGESALAIQNAAFTFPPEPLHFPPELLGLIVLMLTPDIDRRPDIYQVSSVAFRLRNLQCPVKNLNNVSVQDNAYLVKLYRDHGLQRHSGVTPTISNSTERAVRTPNSDTPPCQANSVPSSTSVAPRQRPKPRRGLSPATTPTLDPSLVQNVVPSPPVGISVAAVPPHVVQRLMEQGPSTPSTVVPPTMIDSSTVAVSASPRMLIHEDVLPSEEKQQFELPAQSNLVASQEVQQPQFQHQHHRRNASDPSAALLDSAHLSAFKPYKSQQHVPSEGSSEVSAPTGSWNPFDLDDHSFGLSFDALPRPRKGSNASTVNVKSRESLIIESGSASASATVTSIGDAADLDPFGAAPFCPRPRPPPKPANISALLAQQKKAATAASTDEKIPSSSQRNSVQQAAPSIVATSSLKMKKGYKKLIEDGNIVCPTEALSLRLPPSMARERSGADSDSVGSASDLQARMQASGSSTSDEENVTVKRREKATTAATKSGRGQRVRRTTSSDENEEDNDGRVSTDDGNSTGDIEQYQNAGNYRSDAEEEDTNKLRSVAVSDSNYKIPSTTAPSTGYGDGKMVLEQGGTEGSYYEQELIGHQPLLADDDDEEPSALNQQLLTSHHTILHGNKSLSGSSVGGGTSSSPKLAQSFIVESLELNVLTSSLNSSNAVAGDVFRKAPFFTSPRQQSASNNASGHQRYRYQSSPRSSSTSSKAAAFVNTSFQGDEALRLE